jgi:hypothetical protein
MLNIFGEELEEVVEEEYKTTPAPKLFDWLTSINKSKVDLRVNSVSDSVAADPTLKGYEPFIINKGIGQSVGTIGFANILNRLPHIPKEQQYLFLMVGIPRNKSFAAWAKEEKINNLKEVMDKLCYTKEKAKEAILVLGVDGVNELLHEKGGIQKKVRGKK